MNKTIFKKIPSITKDEVLKVCEFEDIPEYGDIFSYSKFMDNVNSYCITDWDGSGQIILSGKNVKNSCLDISNRTVYIVKELFVPFEVLYGLFGDELKFCWYNK